MGIPAIRMEGHVEAVLVAQTFGNHVSTEVERISVVVGQGVCGDRHYGVPRLADVRERVLLGEGLPKGLIIANMREFSAISVEETLAISEIIGEPHIPCGLLGENLILSGIPNFTSLPRGTLLFFSRGGKIKPTILCVWGENEPCHIPGDAIQKTNPKIEALSTRFVHAAIGRRGIVGFVYSSGFIHRGDTVTVCVPRQQLYDLPKQ